MNEKMKTAATAPAPAQTRADEIFAEMKQQQTASETQTMRDQAEAQAQAEAAEAKRLAAHETIRQRVREELAGKDVEAEREKMTLALDAFVAVCKAYDERFKEILYPLSHDSSLKPLPDDIKVEGYTLFRPFIAGRDVKPASTQRDISNAAKAAIRKHYSDRQTINLNEPQD